MSAPAARAASIAAPRTAWGPSIAQRMLARWLARIEAGTLAVRLRSGEEVIAEGRSPGPRARIEVLDERFVHRMFLGGDIGFAEGYIHGEWTTPDLATLLAFGVRNRDALAGALSRSWTARLVNRFTHARRANTRRGSRRNIAAHYDLGNDFYSLWLDSGMTYSAALFADARESLEVAQRRKYLRLAERLGLSPGDRVLEIGCGWGAFAEIAAREFGCRVVALTLSREQAAYARRRIEEAGLGHVVEVRLQDYRDERGAYDKIVSIEMFEAVGEANWSVYFERLRTCLKPGGKAGLQVITIDDAQFADYRRNPDFIQKYVFPGGMLPSPKALARAVGNAGLTLAEEFRFGLSYAETLRRWADAFAQRHGELAALGCAPAFLRLWHYYLRYCEAGFESGRIDVAQLLIEAP